MANNLAFTINANRELRIIGRVFKYPRNPHDQPVRSHLATRTSLASPPFDLDSGQYSYDFDLDYDSNPAGGTFTVSIGELGKPALDTSQPFDPSKINVGLYVFTVP